MRHNRPWVLFAMIGVIGAAAVAAWTGRRAEADALACFAIVIGFAGAAVMSFYRTSYRG